MGADEDAGALLTGAICCGGSQVLMMTLQQPPPQLQATGEKQFSKVCSRMGGLAAGALCWVATTQC